MTKSRRVSEPKGPGWVLRIAGEHPEARVPPERAPDRVGVHVPANTVPAHVHRTQNPVGVANIEDVRVAGSSLI